MINKASLRAVSEATFLQTFCRPLYDSYNFASIPGTIKQLLGCSHNKRRVLPSSALLSPDSYETVILFFIDGFGWRFFEQYLPDFPFLKRIEEEGIATKLTSQFPSTTAGHVTCINTGQEVGQSGIYEWFYYEPKLDAVIAPLLYSFAGDKRPGTLTGTTPEAIFPMRTLYQELQEEGVDSYVVQYEPIALSPYSQAMFKGANVVPYSTLKNGLTKLVELCKQPAKRPRYFYFYWGDIDGAGHRHGAESKEFLGKVKECWDLMEDFFWQKLPAQEGKVACLFAADHGMTAIDPKTTVYLNKVFPDVSRYFKKTKQGKPIYPAGSSRDFFLHIEEEKVGEMCSILREYLGEVAEILPTEQLIQQGFFGAAPVSQRFLERVGNIVILPYENQSVWWYEKNRFEQHFYAAHGGLSREEMETIFLCINK